MQLIQKAKSSLAGMLIGMLMIVGSICLHAWNEYRTIHRTHGLQEAAAVVQTVFEPDFVNPELDRSLVHLQGRAETQDVLSDDTFGVRSRCIHLARRVEMYQWIEDEDENDEGHKEYSYYQGWAGDRIESSTFEDPHGHENPVLEYPSENQTADKVTIAAYRLNDQLTDEIDSWQPIPIKEAAIRETLGKDAPGAVQVVGETLHWSRGTPNPDDPQLGDLRIRFEHVQPTDVSLIAMQIGDSFQSYETSNGEKIQRLYLGMLSAEEVVGKLMTENTLLAWGIRIGGLVLCVIGFGLALGPIKALVSWIPIVGDLTGFLLFVAGGLMALATSLLTISIAWIAVRPLLGLSLLAISGVAIWLIVRLNRSVREEAPVVDSSMIVGG